MGQQNLQIQHSPKDDMLKQGNKIFKISTFGSIPCSSGIRFFQ